MISYFAGANVIVGVVFFILFLLLHTTVFWLLIYILTLSVHIWVSIYWDTENVIVH